MLYRPDGALKDIVLWFSTKISLLTELSKSRRDEIFAEKIINNIFKSCRSDITHCIFINVYLTLTSAIGSNFMYYLIYKQ